MILHSNKKWTCESNCHAKSTESNQEKKINPIVPQNDSGRYTMPNLVINFPTHKRW